MRRLMANNFLGLFCSLIFRFFRCLQFVDDVVQSLVGLTSRINIELLSKPLGELSLHLVNSLPLSNGR